MARVNWSSPRVRQHLYFEDLDVNESFRNRHGRGAVYTKVGLKQHGSKEPVYYMLEVATGLLWSPTQSPIERVNVEINIGVAKPALY